jgi:hypothetical protein
MDSTFHKFGGTCAIIVGIFSIVYAISYLLVSRAAPELGLTASWIVLAASGLFSSAAYVAIYEQVKGSNSGLALWGVLLGVGASLATLAHGGYEALLIKATVAADPATQTQLTAIQGAPSQADPGGLMTFFMAGVVTFVFSVLITRSSSLPRTLGTLGMVNAVVLVILYLATVFQVQTLILVSGGLTSVILGPIWWIWLGRRLMSQPG